MPAILSAITNDYGTKSMQAKQAQPLCLPGASDSVLKSFCKVWLRREKASSSTEHRTLSNLSFHTPALLPTLQLHRDCLTENTTETYLSAHQASQYLITVHHNLFFKGQEQYMRKQEYATLH